MRQTDKKQKELSKSDYLYYRAYKKKIITLESALYHSPNLEEYIR